MALTDISGSISAYAGGAIDNWAIQRAARQWGIFSRPAQQATGFAAKVGNVLGDDVANLFTKGPKKVLSAAHVESLDMGRQTTVSTAPQEDGAFLSYDKVQAPYQATIRFVCDGSETGNIGENLLPGFVKGLLGNGPDKVRRDFVNTLDQLVEDTNLYFIATPQKIYKRANVISYRFTRQNETADLIVADVTVQEIRNAQSTGWVNSKHPQGAQKEKGGYVGVGDPQVGDLY